MTSEIYVMPVDTFMLTLKTTFLHENNSECVAKDVNIKMSTDCIGKEILNTLDIVKTMSLKPNMYHMYCFSTCAQLCPSYNVFTQTRLFLSPSFRIWSKLRIFGDSLAYFHMNWSKRAFEYFYEFSDLSRTSPNRKSHSPSES